MTISNVKLPRLRTNVPVTADGTLASQAFASFWNQFASAIEESLNGVINAQNAADAAQAAATAANAAAATAQTAADAANTAASGAQGSADAVDSATSLANSYVTGLVLGAADVGTSATIVVSANTRVYGDGTTVAVNSGTITGQAYSTDYWVYYDDPTRSGGAVTYQATPTYADAFPSVANPDRHFVGAVTTPVHSAPPTTGNPARPSNYVAP